MVVFNISDTKIQMFVKFGTGWKSINTYLQANNSTTYHNSNFKHKICIWLRRTKLDDKVFISRQNEYYSGLTHMREARGKAATVKPRSKIPQLTTWSITLVTHPLMTMILIKLLQTVEWLEIVSIIEFQLLQHPHQVEK